MKRIGVWILGLGLLSSALSALAVVVLLIYGAEPTHNNSQPIRLERVEPDPPLHDEGIATHVVELFHINARRAEALLLRLPNREGQVQVLPELNAVLIHDTRGNIRAMSAILDEIDVPYGDRLEIFVYRVEFADAEQVASTLMDIFYEFPVRAIADRRTNTVILVTDAVTMRQMSERLGDEAF